jgi:uncharacterized phage-associated protein
MSHMKLIKLMYLIERQALVKSGRLVTFDWLVSMDHGPVLSATLDKINEAPPANPAHRSYWHRLISAREDHEVRLLEKSPPVDALSPADLKLIDEVWARFGWMNQFQLRDWCHEHLPEWNDPAGSRTGITVADILKAEHFSEEEIAEITSAIEEEERAQQLLR